ncbi:MAG: hypothetical protein ACOYLV_12870 [Rubrivivax sp.]
MAEEDGFLRKVARFVANPTTDWADLNSRQSDRAELDKSELKAMVERKRRNDFVRKREFDMLRRMRRDGLTPEQLAAIGTSSRMDDTGIAPDDPLSRGRGSVTAKIDDIERQMVGDHADSVQRRARLGGHSRPAALAGAGAGSWQPTDPTPLDTPARDGGRRDPPLVPGLVVPPRVGGTEALPTSAFAGIDPLPRLATTYDLVVEEEESPTHDPALDEPVIAFANADFDQCEKALREMVGPDSSHAGRAEVWLVLFDLYRATGQQDRFDALALEYARRVGLSAPTWFSLPRAVADAISDDQPALAAPTGHVGWACPAVLDGRGVSSLRSQALQLPQPWVFDWSAVQRIDVEAATQLSDLFRSWCNQSVDMRWIGVDPLLALMAEAAPAGDRDADPAFWMARLGVLRVLNRADLFDETAIDYCMTYEVSPPAWEPARCRARQSTTSASLQTQPMSIISEVSTSFMESSLFDDEPAQVQVASLELSGQLVGDIGETLNRLDGDIGAASVVNVSCARLIRVDFLAAGDLLNWVLSKRSENRTMQFVDAHRLVALFFNAMGINEHAGVHVLKE